MVQRASALRLAGVAQDLGAGVLRGALSLDGSCWKVGGTSLSDWLKKHDGRQIVLIAAVMDDDAEPKKTCGVCGRDYVGNECNFCREARRRLRGE